MSEIIRRCRLDDATAVAAIYDPIVADTAISFEDIPPGALEIGRRIQNAGDRFPWLVFERDGIVLGYVYAAPHRPRAAYRWAVDVSAYVAPAARRLGVARRLYLELLRLLTAQGYCAAFAGVALPNEASCRLHEGVGFSIVGIYHAVGFKRSAWHDVMWFQRRLRTANEAPSELLALDAVDGSADAQTRTKSDSR